MRTFVPAERPAQSTSSPLSSHTQVIGSASSPTFQHKRPAIQARPGAMPRLNHSLARIPIFPPAADDAHLQVTDQVDSIQQISPSPASVQSDRPSSGKQAELNDAPPVGFSLASIPLEPSPGSKKNNTGLPDTLKAGIESLSGLSMSGVKVHYNSSEPGEVRALAYTRGTEIHVGPGQEQHLPHEAWHVVQQLQGRVRPTAQANGLPLNDEPRLENEAEAMGQRVSVMQAKGEPHTMVPIEARTGTILHASIQRVEDPDGVISDTIRTAYVKLYKTYTTGNLPKPNAMKRPILAIVESATSKEDAYAEFTKLIIAKYFATYDKPFKDDLEKKISKTLTSTEEATAEKNLKQKAELEEIRSSRKAKVAKKEEGSAEREESKEEAKEEKTFTNEEQEAIKAKLRNKKIQKKLFLASTQAYGKHQAKAKPDIKKLAELNKLTEADALSTSDIAQVQASYEREDTGDALLLEKGTGYQVSESRRGGQEVNQLGPYLPGGKKTSVQEIITKLLKDTGLDSAQLAQAIDIRDPKELLERFPKLTAKQIEKIRAMRYLLAVESSRGPEVALATTLEHRSARLGYSHIGDYPKKTTLGPPQATVNLRTAREAQLKIEDKTSGFPNDPAYIPAETQERALKSTTTFIESLVEAPPSNYPEGIRLAEAVQAEQEDDGGPSAMLIDAIADVLRTPEHY